MHVVTDLSDNSTKAIKIIKKFILNNTQLEYAKREADITNRVVHPNILFCHSYFTTRINRDSYFCIITEYCPVSFFIFSLIYQIIYFANTQLGDLDKYIKERVNSNRKIGQETQKLWARQLVNAARYLETQRIIHRDIKPSNILLTEDEDESLKSLKLADFGLARELKVVKR